jgi:endonuclease/exonuclease/phosphatase (EEP) superfamily protein YafD
MRLIRVDAPTARKAIELLADDTLRAEHPLILAGRLNARSWLAHQAGAFAAARKLARQCDALLERFSSNSYFRDAEGELQLRRSDA